MIIEENRPDGPRLAVHGSVAVEMDWALSGALRLGRAEIRPELESLYRNDPQLTAEICSLWTGEEQLSYPGFIELSILAYEGGLLFSLDSDAFLDSLEAVCARTPGEVILASETADDRRKVLRRLEILRTSPKRRRHYVDVVRRTWSALRPAWHQEGEPGVRQQVAARESLLDRHQSWREFVADECKHETQLAQLVEGLSPAGELALVPAFFAHSGLLLDLPGVVIVGVRLADRGAADRARTEQLARRLKAIADPTRMAILSGLARGEMTVSDIARRFDLAQPTVSNHVKLLRDAGLVTMRSEGRSRLLAVDRDALDALGREVQGVLGVSAPAT